jgi:zinc transport system permease protein
MLVVPVATAGFVAQSFKQSILLAILAAEFAVLSGVTIAYVYGLAAGGSIVLSAAAVYATVLVVAKADARWLLRSLPRRTGQSIEHTQQGLEADGGERE